MILLIKPNCPELAPKALTLAATASLGAVGGAATENRRTKRGKKEKALCTPKSPSVRMPADGTGDRERGGSWWRGWCLVFHSWQIKGSAFN